MKRFALLAGVALNLIAQETDLSTLLDAVDTSHAAQALTYETQSQGLRQREELLPNGFSLNAQGGYADSKTTPDTAFEYHVSVDKPIRIADGSTVERLLGTGTEIAIQLGKSRLKNRVYGDYIDACMLQEELWLLEDARSRGEQMEALIHTGMEGGEFDRSAWLRSRLNVQTLTLQIDELNSRYNATLKRLAAATQLTVSAPLCSDLPDTIALPPQHRFDDAPLLRQLENRLNGADALADYRGAWLPEVIVGAGFDDEMDLNRGIVYARLPLGMGSRRENAREAARRSALGARARLQTMRAETAARITAFTTAQQTRKANLMRLNDELIPEAYETTDLLQERFMGSEASYLEYINSQKALFSLLMEGVQLRARALKAEAELFAELGIAPSPSLKKDEN